MTVGYTFLTDVVVFGSRKVALFVFRQLLYRDLGCASYVVGEAGGDAVVVDPRWDIDLYLRVACEDHLKIKYVLDTHDHADHVSGRRRLAAATGAYSYHAVEPGNPAADGIRPGEEISVGSVRMRAIGTPGHRPEHLAFAVSDLARGDHVWTLLTGDSLLVGDLARPDLALDAHSGAELLYSSLRSLVELGDHVEVWPAHIGGSLCGGARLSGKTSSTIGFERLHNPLLMASREVFIRGLTDAIPPKPPNFERIVSINRSSDTEPPDVASLEAGQVRNVLRWGVTVLDARTPASVRLGPPCRGGELAGRGARDGHSCGLVGAPRRAGSDRRRRRADGSSHGHPCSKPSGCGGSLATWSATARDGSVTASRSLMRIPGISIGSREACAARGRPGRCSRPGRVDRRPRPRVGAPAPRTAARGRLSPATRQGAHHRRRLCGGQSSRLRRKPSAPRRPVERRTRLRWRDRGPRRARHRPRRRRLSALGQPARR